MKNLTIITILVALLTLSFLLENTSQKSALKTGDIAFIHFDSEGNDSFSIVALNDIKKNTTIYFTDAEWNGNHFNINEHVMTWNTGDLKILKGTIIDFDTINTTPKVSVGTLDNILKLSKKNEAVFAYTGLAPRVPKKFLSALSNHSTAYGTLINTGLVEGKTALTLPDETYYATLKNSVLKESTESIYNVNNYQVKANLTFTDYRFVSHD